MKNSQKFDLRKFLNENKITTGTHKSKDLLIEDFGNLMPEAGGTQDDKYIHIGYGKYKEKGKEKDSNAQTFTKDDNGKYKPAGGKDGENSGEEKPKVNIFDKPKEEPKSEPTSNDSSEKHDEEWLEDNINDWSDIDSYIENNSSKLSDEQKEKLTQISADWEDGEGEMVGGFDDEDSEHDYDEVVSDAKQGVLDVLNKTQE